MTAKNLEIAELRKDVDRLTVISKEWEAAHIGRITRTSNERQRDDGLASELESAKAMNMTL